MKNRLLLVGRYHVIEPLGIIYLSSLAESLGWETKVHLVKDSDFSPLFAEIVQFRPHYVGFSVLTGNHQKVFEACDRVRASGIPVIVGGPHATYFTEECLDHADYVIKGDGFRNLRRVLQGEIKPGLHFDPDRIAEGFPRPRRESLYNSYPELGKSDIKSIICTMGCPFSCTYCYSEMYNKMYGKFEAKIRPVDDVINEAVEIKNQWPAKMIYFQDDNFGLRMEWLKEFIPKWKSRVGLPWHCQIRLELTRDPNRLSLFRDGGCTGITLAIESGDPFMREYVLNRHMDDALIFEGVKKIKDHGFKLRTEQILAMPFSDIKTDIGTLKMNCLLRPEMAWTSILVPYSRTEIWNITNCMGMYSGNNNDIQDSFFSRSVLRHCKNGLETIRPIVEKLKTGRLDNPLLRLQVDAVGRIYEKGSSVELGKLEYLTEAENERYKDQTVILHDLFNNLALLPQGWKLGERIVSLPKAQWTFEKIGNMTRDHIFKTSLYGIEPEEKPVYNSTV